MSVENERPLARPADQALAVPVEPASGLAPSGFYPSRIRRPGFDQRLTEFEERLFNIRWIGERVMAGQQFNAWPTGEEDDETDDEDIPYLMCIGHAADLRLICRVYGRQEAELLESALKVATEAFREKIARDSAQGPLKMPRDPAWYARMAELEGDSEISAGILHPEVAPRDSDGNPEGGDGTAPSRSDDSAGPKDIAPPLPQSPNPETQHDR